MNERRTGGGGGAVSPLPLLLGVIALGLLQIFPPPSRSEAPQKTGTIVPQPSTPDTFAGRPTPITFRIINRSPRAIYLQGLRQKGERPQIYFYHRKARGGWTPFIEFLPCDLPACRNVHSPRQDCPKAVPFIISLGAAGASESVKEARWEGRLYQRSEATQESRGERYCYKESIPKSGQMRVEVEFSETVQKGKGRQGLIGARDHGVVEFDLPPSQNTFDIFVGGSSAP